MEKEKGTTTAERGARSGIQSIEVGVPLLKILARSASPMSLSTLAKEADISASRTHKYLVSFQRCGLIEQVGAGKYDLGPMTFELGIAALRRTDIVRLAAPVMSNLREQVGETIVLTTWINGSAVVVSSFECDRPVGVSVKIGSRLPDWRNSRSRESKLGGKEPIRLTDEHHNDTLF